jgi:succinate dehydrogenase / fumarate reductase, cytochrome b subunit
VASPACTAGARAVGGHQQALHNRSITHMATANRPVVKPRPVYLNLLAIRQPIPAVVSILHRISGALLFLVGVPLGLWALQASLLSAEGYQRVASVFAHPLAKLVLLGLIWSYLHHLIAGVRHLLADIHIGLELKGARQSAAVSLVLGVLLTAAIGVKLW